MPIENSRLKKAMDKMEKQEDLTFYKGVPKCCASCKHWDKMITDEPCFICNNSYNKWEKP